MALVCLIFDRYRDYCIRGQTRLKRLGQYARIHTLTILLYPTTLKATRTKVPMINLITRSLLDHCTSTKYQNTLAVTGQDSIPIQTEHDIEILRKDMETTHQEADVIIPQQIQIAKLSRKVQKFKVICDDRRLRATTLLLCHPEING